MLKRGCVSDISGLAKRGIDPPMGSDEWVERLSGFFNGLVEGFGRCVTVLA
jgi:hypothetical protein